MPKNRIVPDVQEKCKNWRDTTSDISPEHIVLLDESGVNIDMTRRYGRAVHAHHVVNSTPLNTPISATVLGAIRLNGDIRHTNTVVERQQKSSSHI